VRVIGSVCAATDLDDLRRRFLAGAGGAIRGFELHDPPTVATANVSDAFLARYEQEARAVDPVLAEALRTGRPAYNLALMSPREREESAAYRRAYQMHHITHLAIAPLMRAGRVIGVVRVAEPDGVAAAEALAAALTATVERVRA
jgi:hypothetical protein